MSVIDSLSAGFRFLGRHIELLIAPILLDLLFWLGPQLSIAPLLEQVSAFYTQTSDVEGMPAEMATLSSQMATALSQLGENFSILGVLANTSLMHVPSLMAGSAPISQGAVIKVDTPLAGVLLLIGLSVLGLLIGVVYMSMLARTLPLGDAPKPMHFGEFVRAVMRHWGMVLLYVALIIVVLVIGSIPITLAVTLLSLINPVIGSLLLMLLSGTFLVILFYLYFVTAGIIMDNLPVHRAIAQSFVLVRSNFWATLGFVILYNLISLGFAFILASLAEVTPVGTIAAILIYAYIGTGLVMGMLVFYRTRILKQEIIPVSAT